MIVGVVILFIAGIVAIIACVFLVRWQLGWQKNGKLVMATVIYKNAYYGGGYIGGSPQSSGYRIGVQYVIDGKTYKNEFDGSRKMKQGKTIPLLYKANDPYKIWYNEPIRFYFGVMLMLGIAVGCFVGAISLLCNLLV